MEFDAVYYFRMTPCTGSLKAAEQMDLRMKNFYQLKTKNYGQRTHTGFTLIETLMALFVLMTGVVTGFAVISQAVHTSPISRQQLIAAGLAQEGIEMTRNVRDNRLLIIADGLKRGTSPSKNWAQDLEACNNSTFGEYRMFPELADLNDISSSPVVECKTGNVGDRPLVYKEPNINFYANVCDKIKCKKTTWQDTGFRRVMSVEKYIPDGPDAGNELDPDNICTTNCTEVRVKVKVYWYTDTEPATCPADNCILVEDRFTGWVDYLESFL